MFVVIGNIADTLLGEMELYKGRRPEPMATTCPIDQFFNPHTPGKFRKVGLVRARLVDNPDRKGQEGEDRG